MGNRANVVFTAKGHISPAVYLHWNGGANSVYAFLDEMDRRGIRTGDPSYESARFAQIVGEFFDFRGCGGLSLGLLAPPNEITLEGLKPLQHGDNGVYVVRRGSGDPFDDSDQEREVRRFHSGREHTPEQVEAEREQAYRSDYMDPEQGIPSVFEDYRRWREANAATEEVASTT